MIEKDKHKLYANLPSDNEPMENFTRVFNLDVPSKLPESMKWVDESFFKEQEIDPHQQLIRSLNNRIEKLRKRLNDTETFCDSLRNALKEYEQ